MEECTELKEVPAALQKLEKVITDLEDKYEKFSQKLESVLSQDSVKTMNLCEDCPTRVKLAQEIQDNVGKLQNLVGKFNDLLSRCQL